MLFKKFIPFVVLFLGLTFMASSVSAQLKFKNATPCQVRLKAAAQDNATPCAGPYCVSGVITVPAFTTVTIPFGPCLVSPAGLGYSAIKLGVTGGGSAVVDACNGPNPTFVGSCPFSPVLGYTLQIFNSQEAGIF